jgi:hypothetical protein
VSSTHSSSQALLSNPLGNLENSNSSAMQQVNLTNTQSQSNVGTADSQVMHPASVTPLDAVFIEMSPVENLTI